MASHASDLLRARLAASSRAQRADADDDELPPQRAAAGKRTAIAALDDDRPAAEPTVHRWSTGDDPEAGLPDALDLAAASTAGHGLPTELARRLEAELGVDLSRVRLHDDARAHAAAAAVQARAFTIGHDIYFAAGAYDPTSAAGVELIAHEVAHVAQHARGTAPTDRRVSRPDDHHEREADRFARGFQHRRVEHTVGPGSDPAELVEHARREGRRMNLPFLGELEDQLGTSFDFVEAYTGPAAQVACEALAASAMVVRNIVLLADPSPSRELLLHELTHVQQMGQRRAPAQFALGTLRVSDPGDAAELEARSLLSPTVAADPDTIHRDGNGTNQQPAQTTSTPQQRVQYFIDQHKTSGLGSFSDATDTTESTIRFRGKTTKHRYRSSSREPWKKEDYVAVLDRSPHKVASGNYAPDMDEIRANGRTYQIARVTDRTYAYLGDAGKYDEEVEDLSPAVRPKADPQEQFECYFEMYRVLRGRLASFTYPSSAEAYKQNNVTMDEAEATAYRRAMRTALVTAYAALPNGGWEEFYNEVMQGKNAGGGRLIPAKYNGLTGSIFEELVRTSTGITLSASKPFFKHADLHESPRIGDSFSGSVLIDGKAATAGAVREQAEDYLTIVKKPVKGWIKGEDENDPKRIYQAVLYTAAGRDNATTINNQIKAWFRNAADRAKFGVSPDPDGVKRFVARFNPTLEFTTEEAGLGTYRFTAPTNPVPGVTVKEARFTATSDDARVTGGSIRMDVDMAGAVKGENITKPITAGEGNTLAGSVENKLTGFRSTLDRVLGAVEVDAKLVDGGAEATIKVKAGAARIPNFELNEANLTARYVNGALSVEGEVGITHTSRKVSGRVRVSWDGAAWAFDGQATLAAGLVPGLSAVTLGVRYVGGKTTLYCQQAAYERRIGAVNLTGTVRNLEYDVDRGSFSGNAELSADMGMFGRASASATLENNDLKSATLSYDSPEFKYPSTAANPAFRGTVGGTVTYNEGRFSGAIRGGANINIPALRAVAGESGMGLAVDAHINADGTYGGTVRTTSPLNFGRHIQVPSVSCTIKDDGSLEGSFEIKVVNIKYLTEATIRATVNREGIQIEDARIEVPFGNQESGKFWGTLRVGYSRGQGLQIGGDVNYKIKEGMVATGTLRYSTETHEVSLTMTVSEITLLDKTVSKTLFRAAKQIPIINVYGLGVYIDIGFELGFNFGFHLGLRPTVEFEGLSLETFDFRRIGARLELLGNIFAELVGTPRLGLGVFALSPSILRGGGGLKVPIVGRAEIRPTGTLNVGYTPSGGVEGDAKLGMNMTFGITGSVKPYAEFSVLDGLWNPSWEGDALTSFEILKPKELFNFVVDLGGDMTRRDEPPLPAENAAADPTPPAADRVLPETKGAPTERSGGSSNRSAEGPTAPVAESGNEGPFSLSALKPLLEQLPGASTVKGFLDKAYRMYQRLAGAFNRVMNVFKDFFRGVTEAAEEIVTGFANEGLAYLPKLVKKIVGDSVYEIIEPLIQASGNIADKLLELFETDPPRGLTDFMPWVWKVAKRVLGLAFDSLSGFISAIQQMLSRAGTVARRLINRAVTDGWVGVKRHAYYIWRPWPWDDYKFVAAAEYKVNIPGVVDLGRHGPPGVLLTPGAAVAIGLYELLDQMGVPVTYGGSTDFGQPYNDRWTGDGARG